MLRTRLYTASVAAVAACRPTLMQHCRRSEFHCSARLASLTGIAFSPVAPAELKGNTNKTCMRHAYAKPHSLHTCIHSLRVAPHAHAAGAVSEDDLDLRPMTC